MKEENSHNTIFTIGHSTHSAHDFISLLKAFGILMLADVRNFPGSRRFPHFNKDNIESLLSENQIGYVHLKDLGGRRKPLADSINTRWRNSAFRGYADYMGTAEFKIAIATLEHIALQQPTAYMCAEGVWWSCHRSLISDYLKIRGWKVMHIMNSAKADEHPFTSASRIVNNQLRYDEPELF
jgi:uncharacterized protein (DUF488 family)